MKKLIDKLKKLLPSKNKGKENKGEFQLVKGAIFAFFPISSTVITTIVKHLIKNKKDKSVSE